MPSFMRRNSAASALRIFNSASVSTTNAPGAGSAAKRDRRSGPFPRISLARVADTENYRRPNTSNEASRGWPIVLSSAAVLLVGMIVWLIHMWRTDRRLLIELLGLVVVGSVAATVGDHHIGGNFAWMLFSVPSMFAYFGILLLINKRLPRREEPS